LHGPLVGGRPLLDLNIASPADYYRTRILAKETDPDKLLARVMTAVLKDDAELFKAQVPSKLMPDW
jgi:hypothetical protein